ncbi:DUF2188 domain-containing protein [Pseudalkalibacillus berkeleyi]|uniref:DUF2188 domain-containing protein n=1 Tax=Pseudalkalibacillus berkeleyi TaxID=1069813 RepID=A0ABS9H537_9BACL|nr:DUF2188 domain-containing protein [Pseudalkalibacillus berkeleyi]MCF6139008.1 DUF2188 domain-containing protein [Pseudalkalibacillus berkeleyi]
MEAKIFHVVPNEEKNKWDIKIEGRDHAEKTFDKKDIATDEARKLADEARPSQVVLHRENGEIEDVSKYSTNG